MCRVTSRELDPAVTSAADARDFVGRALRRWGLAALVADAGLLTSELVTNAVLHARSTVTVTVAVTGGVAEIGVADRSSVVPRSRTESWHDESGRGLRLVELVAQEWGVVAMSGGKQVWFRLEVDAGWPYLTECPCQGEDLERVRLESGRYAVAAPGPWDTDPG